LIRLPGELHRRDRGQGRDGRARNKPICIVIRVTVTGERDILGLRAGDGGEDAKFWLQVLAEPKNRGVADVCIVVCDGLKGLPDAITAVCELAAQQCIIHLIRNTFRLASQRYWDRLKRDLQLISAAPNEPAARAGVDELNDSWRPHYPAIVRLWQNAGSSTPEFLDYDLEIRRHLLHG